MGAPSSEGNVSLTRIVVIGASAGGFEAVRTVLGGLPDGFPAAVLVVIHTGPAGILPVSLSRHTTLPVRVAGDGERLEAGQVYVPPPDRHLTVVDGAVRVARGPREHGFRPAIDPLFTTAAKAAGPLAAGVILSGALSDGTLGLHAIQRAGGLTLVQSPLEAIVPSMPVSALGRVVVAAVLPASEIGRELTEWAMNGRGRPSGAAGQDREGPGADRREPDAPAQLMAVTCPSCGGAISEAEEEGLTHYECHVGHRFDPESLVSLTDERTENTLWMAVRALQEQALLRRRMLERARARGLETLASTWHEEAVEAESRAGEIRRLIEGAPAGSAALLVGAGTASPTDDAPTTAPRGRRVSGEDLATTREQARLSQALHRASRRKTAGAAPRGKGRRGRQRRG
jgi:two-component system chemotaxis response regulator CheB